MRNFSIGMRANLPLTQGRKRLRQSRPPLHPRLDSQLPQPLACPTAQTGSRSPGASRARTPASRTGWAGQGLREAGEINVSE